MNDAIREVFTIVGVLVAVFLLWQVVFTKGGVFNTAYNAVAGAMNQTYQESRGINSEVLPIYEDSKTTYASSNAAKNSLTASDFDKSLGD